MNNVKIDVLAIVKDLINKAMINGNRLEANFNTQLVWNDRFLTSNFIAHVVEKRWLAFLYDIHDKIDGRDDVAVSNFFYSSYMDGILSNVTRVENDHNLNQINREMLGRKANLFIIIFADRLNSETRTLLQNLRN